jgi:hypothetical protein
MSTRFTSFVRRYVQSPLPLTMVLFTFVTVTYSVDFTDGPWTNSPLFGFPLPFIYYGVVSSMQTVCIVFNLMVDLLASLLLASATLLLCRRITLSAINRKRIRLLQETIAAIALLAILYWLLVFLLSDFRMFLVLPPHDVLHLTGLHFGLYP